MKTCTSTFSIRFAKSLAGIALLMVAALIAVPRPGLCDGTRVTEQDFSWVAPPGWEVRDFPGMKFKIAFGQPADGFAPNITIVDEQFHGDIVHYFEANMKTMTRIMPNLKKISITKFQTDSGIDVIHLISEYDASGHHVRGNAFFLSGNNDTKYVVTGSSLASDGDRFDARFSDSARTFAMN